MKKIIIVEDEEILRNLLYKKLTAEGYKVETAEDGEEGLAKIKVDRPDLILLDIIMPKMNGIEMMEEMAKEESLKGIPVIVVSNSGQPVEIDKAQKLGARDWLVKTEFEPQEVIDKVIAQIGRGSTEEGEEFSAPETPEVHESAPEQAPETPENPAPEGEQEEKQE